MRYCDGESFLRVLGEFSLVADGASRDVGKLRRCLVDRVRLFPEAVYSLVAFGVRANHI